jgi:hypothetical protein
VEIRCGFASLHREKWVFTERRSSTSSAGRRNMLSLPEATA